MLSKEKYIHYSVENFVCDEDFQNWIFNADAEGEAFWKAWVVENPGRKDVIDAAAKVLRNMSFREDKPPEGWREASLRRSLDKIKLLEDNVYPHPASNKNRWYLRVAAIGIIIIAIGYLLSIVLNRGAAHPTTITTAFGQIDSANLPDASLIILNGHSSISYSKNWDKHTAREVWMKGEAYFDIQHTKESESLSRQFKVHVGPITVEVLGTSFNIRERRGKIEVALLRGSIKIKSGNQMYPDILMSPGELITLDTITQAITKTTTNAENLSAWTQKKLVLNNPTLKEIAMYLEDTYGKKIILADPRLGSRKVEGPILLDSLEDALFILSTVLDITIAEKNNTLIFNSK